MRAGPIATASRVDDRVDADGLAMQVGEHVQPVAGLIRPVNRSPTIRRKLHRTDGSVIDGTNLPTDAPSAARCGSWRRHRTRSTCRIPHPPWTRPR
jgi:hypothetical protein